MLFGDLTVTRMLARRGGLRDSCAHSDRGRRSGQVCHSADIGGRVRGATATNGGATATTSKQLLLAAVIAAFHSKALRVPRFLS